MRRRAAQAGGRGGLENSSNGSSVVHRSGESEIRNSGNQREAEMIASLMKMDENGDGNWVTWDPRTDSNVESHLDGSNYFYYLYSCEAGSGFPVMDPAHPHPCAKIRAKLINTWEDGQSESSEWFEVWLAKEQNPAVNQPYQKPSIC